MSCLFHSLAKFVSHNDFRKLRQDICNYLDSNKPLLDELTIKEIAELDGITKEQYIENMRQDSTWGGAPEIRAFCEIYNVGVKVLVIQSGKLIEFKSTKESTIFVLISWNGNHFEPVLPTK